MKEIVVMSDIPGVIMPQSLNIPGAFLCIGVWSAASALLAGAGIGRNLFVCGLFASMPPLLKTIYPVTAIFHLFGDYAASGAQVRIGTVILLAYAALSPCILKDLRKAASASCSFAAFLFRLSKGRAAPGGDPRSGPCGFDRWF